MTHLDFDLGAGVFWPPPLADEVQPEINKKNKFFYIIDDKVEKILKGSLDSIP